jgi:hypothetical protein
VEYPCRPVSSKVLDLLASEDDHILDLVQYPYVGMD